MTTSGSNRSLNGLRTGSIPDADGLVKRCRHDEIILGVKGRAHHVMIVPRQDREARARLPVPDANRLVVRGAHLAQTKNNKAKQA